MGFGRLFLLLSLSLLFAPGFLGADGFADKKKEPCPLNFIPLLEYETFSAKTCQRPRKNVVCGHSSDLLQVYAEADRQNYIRADYIPGIDGNAIKPAPNEAAEPVPEWDSFQLIVKRRGSLEQKFDVQEYAVSFSYRDGVVVVHKKDFYDPFEIVCKNHQLPVGIQRWMVDIMAALKPGFTFTARE